MASGTFQHFQHAVEVFQDPLAQHLPPIGPVAPDEPQPMEPASPELEPTQQRRQPLLVSLAAVTTTAKNRPMLSTSRWRLRPLTHLPPSKPRARWVRQPSGTDCVSAMATQGDWGRLRSSRTQGAQVGVNALPTALVAPGWEVAIHSLPRRKVPRQHAPEPARRTYRMASTTAGRLVLRGRPNGESAAN